MKRAAPVTGGGPVDYESSAYVQILGRRSHRHLVVTPGSQCWVLLSGRPASNACLYRKATVVEYIPGAKTVRIRLEESQEESLPVEQVLEAEDSYIYDDAATMKVLNYPNVLENIRQRFEGAAARETDRQMIYTYAGWVLFAVNPYSPCSALYSDAVCERYYRKAITQEKPHPFALASTAFSRLTSDRKSQYILISGESGGGKTECSKHVLKYLTWVTRRQRRQRGRVSIGGPGDAAETVASLLTAASPLLEFFGNAKTVRNDNSSRFGKLFQLCYDAPGEKLLSAHLSTYLLAKSRVVQVPQGEENYHVFPALMSGLDQSFKAGHLCMSSDFTSPFLGSDWKGLEAVPRAYRSEGPFCFDNLVETLREFGVDDAQRLDILKLLAAILHLGNLKFATIEGSVQCESRIVNPEVCVIVCKLLGIALDQCEQLETVLTSKQIRDTRSRLNPDQCRSTTFSLCKGVYECLFFYVVQLVRQKLEHAESLYGTISGSSATSPSAAPCIGVLDLFGFENMEPDSRNGFEQLCINYANEQLHYHFMTEVIERERETYQSEGVVCRPMAFFNDLSGLMTQDTLLLLLGVKGQLSGIFPLLEDVNKLGGGDRDRAFCRQANELIAVHYRPAGGCSPTKRRRNMPPAQNPAGASHLLLDTQFTINHFAEPVAYTTQGFSARNQDYMSEEVRHFLIVSNPSSFISVILASEDGQSVSPAKPVSSTRSLSGVFRSQMSALMATLDQTSCYFIRCLKPNDLQEAFMFDRNRVLKQLVTGGVGPVLELMKEGYPCRLTYQTLWQKFKDYLPLQLQNKLTPRDFGDLALSYLRVNPESYALGSTRVFFRFGILQLMQGLLEDMTEAETAEFAVEVHKHQMVIKLVRCACALIVGSRLVAKARRLKYKRVANEAVLVYKLHWLPRRQEHAAFYIQQYIRAVPERFWFLAVRRGIPKIQRTYRRRLLRRLLATRRAEKSRQHAVSGVVALLLRYRFKKQSLRHGAAMRIQAIWRGFLCRKILLEQIRQHYAKVILFAWRRYKLRKALRKIFSRRAPVPDLAEWTSPIRNVDAVPPVSPSRAGVTRSTRRASMAYQDTRTFWEISAVNPSAGHAEIVGEVRRRRRSIFCQVPSPTGAGPLLLSPAALGDDFSSPTFGSCCSPPDIKEESSSLKRSRRCIESGAPFGGDESHAVVDLVARAMSGSTQTLHPAGRLSVADLSGPPAEEIDLSSSAPGEESDPSTEPLSELLPAMGNCRSAPKSPPQKLTAPRELTTTADSASPELVFRSEPSPMRPLLNEKHLIAGSRLSIRAWRGEGDVVEDHVEDPERPPSPSPQSSLSCSVLTPGGKRGPETRPPWPSNSFPSSSDPDQGATPLFGLRKPSAEQRGATPPSIAKPITALQPPSKDDKENNTPRPRQLFCLPRKPVPSTRLPTHPLACFKLSKQTPPISSKIPLKPNPTAPVKIIKLKQRSN